MSRLLLSAALALAVLGVSAPTEASTYARHHHRAYHHGYATGPHSYEFYSYDYPSWYRPHVGGHSYYWQHRAWPFVNGASYNYPGFYNNQTFWERVQTQANYPVQY